MNKLLFLCPIFYGYEKIILNELNKRYDKTYFKNEVPFNSPKLYYIIRRICPFIEGILWKFYINDIQKLVRKEHVSELLIIRGKYLPEEFLYLMKYVHGIKIIQYQWDSINNNPNALIIMKYAWKNFTFDKYDSNVHKEFKYLPLFYDWDYSEYSKLKYRYAMTNFDVLFVSFWSYERFEKYEQIRALCEKEKLKLFAHIYMPFQSYVRRILLGEKIPYHIIKFRKLNRDEYKRLLQNSQIVFDVPSSSQVGSTMRTIETMSMKKKLLTTNYHVKDEIFYKDDNIFFWPLESGCTLHDIISRQFNVWSYNNICRIDTWVDSIFE